MAHSGKRRGVKIALTVIGLALLTLILSPSYRRAALRGLFARDFPETPYDFEPKYRIYRKGVRVA